MARKQKPNEDYGQLFRENPARIETPRSIEELARTLRRYNDAKTPVTLRNTAHSCNGQTLTTGVQLNLSRLTKTRFDREAMTVTTGPGSSWNSVLKEVDFPNFCLPIFPNNPGQLIHVGGTAGVGGVGYYGSKVGGFWNSVRSFKLVTMEGEIVECSREKNSDLFRYSLGGFGRLGVIGEVTVDVVPSKTHVLGMLLVYRRHEDFEHDMMVAMNDRDLRFDGVAGQEDLPSQDTIQKQITTALDLKILTVIKEVDPEDTMFIKDFVKKVRIKYSAGIMLFMNLKDSNLDVSLEPVTFKKREIVYFSPQAQNFFLYLIQRVCQFLTGGVFRCAIDNEKRGTKHPWNDCIVPLENDCYGNFMAGAKRIIARYGFQKRISKQSIFHGLINVDSFVTFLIKKIEPEKDYFPVALDLPGERQVSMGLAIMPDLPPDCADELEDMLRMNDELTELTYKLGGRRYLYGYHRLTRDQLIDQYGEPVIRRWNELKESTDPRRLLNIGVISRHLDEF